MVTKGLPSLQSPAEAIGNGSHALPMYVPDYTVVAVTDLLIVRVTEEQYAGALHAASLDRHLRATGNCSGDGGQDSDHSQCGDLPGTPAEFPMSSDAATPMAEFTSSEQLLDSDDATNSRDVVSNQNQVM